MSWSRFEVLREPGVAPLVVLGFFARMPQAMCGLVLTLHAVRTLDRGYAEAGLVTAAFTVGLGLGAPWRGRTVDRQGLRRALVPSLVGAGAWLVAPWLGFSTLVAVAFVGGLLLVPAYSVTRQSLAVLVPDDRRETAFALDAVANELTWMVGPLLAVLLATGVSTDAALVTLGGAALAAGISLMVMNPPTHGARDVEVSVEPVAPVPARHGLVSMLGLCVAMAVLFVGVEVSIVAVLNEVGRPGDVGWVVACWSAGSLVGGLWYASLSRQLSPLLLMLAFVLLLAPVAVAPVPVGLAVALVVSGLPSAPTLAAVMCRLTELAPVHRRGEVMGWSGAAMTVGSALGAPVVGWVIDDHGGRWGFVAAAVIGMVVLGLVVVGPGLGALVRRGARRAAPGGRPPASPSTRLRQATAGPLASGTEDRPEEPGDQVDQGADDSRPQDAGAQDTGAQDTGPVSRSPGPSPGASG